MRVLRKHDPDNTLYFTRDQYKEVLIDIVLIGMEETDSKASEEDSKILRNALSAYVEEVHANTVGAEITYKAVLLDL